MEKKKYFYGYKITNNINNHFYYGIHTTYNLNDNYMGSGIRLNKAYKKYGKENFTKEIIKFFDNENDMISWEQNIVTEELVKNQNCYNSQIGGKYVQSLDMIPVIDENGNIIKVFRDNQKYLSGEYKYMFKGKTIVKDNQGNIFAVDCNKIPNNCHGIRYQQTTVIDENGNKINININDEKYKNGKYKSIYKGYVTIKDGNNYRRITLDEFKNGNYDYMFKNTIIANINGKHKRISLDDPKYKSGEIKSIYHNTSMYKDKNGNIFRCNINDPKVLSGEYVGITKGNKLSPEHNKKIHEKQKGRIHINNGNEMKYIYQNELNTYIENGWKIGGLPTTMSDETKNNMKNKLSKMFKGRIYINNGIIEKIIKPEDLDNYINNGWKKGQLKQRNHNVAQNKKWINNGLSQKYVSLDIIDTYLNNGWQYGMIKRKKN